MKKENRRTFLLNSFKTAAIATLGITGLDAISGKTTIEQVPQKVNGNCFDQQPLPYAYNALEDIIDATTMELHYSKHAAAYSKNAKEAAIAEKINTSDAIETILSRISSYSVKMRNNAGGHYNHELFWQCMQPKKTDNKPSQKMQEAIAQSFGDFTTFKSIFSEAAKTQFGSGWAWLYLDNAGKMQVGNTPNQDNPLMDIAGQKHKGSPLLCLDVWEHAYYLKYQNRRAEYIEKWWNLVNWEYVEKRWKKVI